MLRWIQSNTRKYGTRNEKSRRDANDKPVTTHDTHNALPGMAARCEEAKLMLLRINNNEGGWVGTSKKAQTKMDGWMECEAI